jgi:hypothetical protein
MPFIGVISLITDKILVRAKGENNELSIIF